MADPKIEALKRMAGLADEAPVGRLAKRQADRSVAEKILEYMGRPGAATRAAIAAAQAGEAPGEAFMTQIGRPTEEAPTGADIAETFGQAADIQDPYALTGMATLMDVAADPTGLIPFGKVPAAMRAVKKAPEAIKGMGRGERALSKVGDIEFPARSKAEALKIAEALKETGQVPKQAITQLGERAPLQMKEALTTPAPKRRVDLPEEEIDELFEQFPKLRERWRVKR